MEDDLKIWIDNKDVFPPILPIPHSILLLLLPFLASLLQIYHFYYFFLFLLYPFPSSHHLLQSLIFIRVTWNKKKIKKSNTLTFYKMQLLNLIQNAVSRFYMKYSLSYDHSRSALVFSCLLGTFTWLHCCSSLLAS